VLRAPSFERDREGSLGMAVSSARKATSEIPQGLWNQPIENRVITASKCLPEAPDDAIQSSSSVYLGPAGRETKPFDREIEGLAICDGETRSAPGVIR
jgi:hypothetical protein